MKFSSTRGSASISFSEALLNGYPSDAGLYAPSGEADVRTAVYAPEASFADAASIAASALFPAELDPRKADSVASAAFSCAPTTFAYGEDILIADLAAGAGASEYDYDCSFLAGVIEQILPASAVGFSGYAAIAAASGSEASALAFAFSHRGDLPLVLLLPEGPVLGIEPECLKRNGGTVTILRLRADHEKTALLERALSGATIAGRRMIAAGRASPGRLAGRTLLVSALFSLASRGVSGDLILASAPGDSIALVCGLWAWSWGLPATAFLSAEVEGRVSGLTLGAGAELLESFNRRLPIGSLVIGTRSSEKEARTEADRLREAGGPDMDRASSLALAGARRALNAGLGGHARIVVPRFADPFWDLDSESDTRSVSPFLKGSVEAIEPDEELDASPARLQEALEAIFSGRRVR